jgi:predicted metal-dependent hydrolase
MTLPVEVVRSTRRRKTVQAVVVDGRIRVHLPAWMSEHDEQTYVASLVERLQRQYRSDHVDLVGRAATLAQRYGLPLPRSVQWSDRQRARWGSCTTATRDIRVSRRLAEWPSWVLDYVLVHELAHLAVPNHSPEFHALVDRYPRAERAKGFLMAKGLYGDEDDEAAAPVTIAPTVADHRPPTASRPGRFADTDLEEAVAVDADRATVQRSAPDGRGGRRSTRRR